MAQAKPKSKGYTLRCDGWKSLGAIDLKGTKLRIVADFVVDVPSDIDSQAGIFDALEKYFKHKFSTFPTEPE